MSDFAIHLADYASVSDLRVANRAVLVRVDYNVPYRITPDGVTQVADDYRIRVSLPTIRYLLERGARVVILTHWGRPQGCVVPALSTLPLAERLGELLGQGVAHAPDCIGRSAEQAIADLPAGQVLMLENTRFHLGEQLNQYDFIRRLVKLGEVFINEAFPALHRAHASLSGLAAFMPESALGLRIREELGWLQYLANGDGPLRVVLGGGQVGSQLELMHRLLGRADVLMIGGVLAHTFLAARDQHIGMSRYEPTFLEAARHFLAEAGVRGCRIQLPTDLTVSQRHAPVPDSRPVGRLQAHEASSGIGAQTAQDWQRMMASEGRLLWLDGVGGDVSHGLMARAVTTPEGHSQHHLVGGDELGFSLQRLGLREHAARASSGHAVLASWLSGHGLPALQVLQARQQGRWQGNRTGERRAMRE